MRILPTCFGIILATAPLAAGNAGWTDFFKSVPGLSPPPAENSGGLSDADIADGLREALAVGAERAVDILGRQGGFLQDPQVHIPLPKTLQTAAKGLRLLGQGQLADDFETTMNRAAEQAIPQTLQIVKDTVREMTWQDVRGILNGGDDSATQFLREHAGERLRQAVRPVVAEATDRSGATAAYKRLVSRLGDGLGGLAASDALDLDSYVTEKALDGLFLKLAAEEREIRRNPVARSTDLLKKVFGS